MNLLTVTKEEFLAETVSEDLEMQGLSHIQVAALEEGFDLIDDIRKNYKPKNPEDLEFVLEVVFDAIDSEAYASATLSSEHEYGFRG